MVKEIRDFLEKTREKTRVSEWINDRHDRYISISESDFKALKDLAPRCCKECILQKTEILKSLQDCYKNRSKPYIISFFNKDKYEIPLSLMVVSENPNWYNSDKKPQRNKGSEKAKDDKRIKSIDELGKYLEIALNIKNGFFSIFHQNLREKNPKSHSIDELMERKDPSSNKFSTYWTHIVKCYACNNHPIIDCAFCNCKEILRTEIEHLKPRIIIALGDSAYNKVSMLLNKEMSLKEYTKIDYKDKDYKEKIKKEGIPLSELLKIDNKEKIEKIEYIIRLPHPSGGNVAYSYCHSNDKIILKSGPKC